MVDVVSALFDIAGIFSGSADIVGIFDSNSLQQVFLNARPLKAIIRETSKVMDHPAESGIILSDHHIINPVEIDLPLMISAQYYGSMYQQIRNAFYNATLFSVQTRTGVYPNMIIANLPHEEDPSQYDAITMALHLKEVLFVPSPSTYAPIDPVNNDTVQVGQQQPVTPIAPPPEPVQKSFFGSNRG